MIVFPDPYPDEILYSAVARFAHRMHMESSAKVMQRCFGATSAILIGFPQHLAKLIGAMQAGHEYTADDLVNGHTLLPFYAPFIPVDRLSQVLECMKYSPARAIKRIAGVFNRNVPEPRYLRFCLECNRASRSKYGEAYWHRSHQLPGIDVCYVHGTYLEESKIRTQYRPVSERLVTAESGSHDAPVRSVNPNDATDALKWKFARNAAWLLKHSPLSLSHSDLYQRYDAWLRHAGFLTASGLVRGRKLHLAVKSSYPSELLEALNYDTETPSESVMWISRLLGARNVVHAPARHLLIMDFLGHTPQSLFASIEFDHLPKETDMCLNPFCAQHGQMTARQVSIQQRCNRPIRGVFRCSHCDYTYSQCIVAGSARKQIVKVVEYGRIWRKRFESLWEDNTVSVLQIAVSMRLTNHHRVRYLAEKWNLRFPRENLWRITVRKKANAEKRRSTPDNEKLQFHRRVVSKDFVENPHVWNSHRAINIRRSREWLYRHDREWLYANTQPGVLQKGKSGKRRMDRTAQDQEMAGKVRSAASTIKGNVREPVRITVAALLRHLGMGCVPRSLPLTLAAIASLRESELQYAIRKIQCAAEVIFTEGRSLTRGELIRRAFLGYRMVKRAEVNAAIIKALEE